MPTDWKLEGSIDGNEWVQLDSRSGQTQWKKDSEETFLVQNPGDYTDYRFIFQKGGNPQLIRIYEIKFIEKDQQGKFQAVDSLEYEWEPYSH